jgi:hypothetical protein
MRKVAGKARREYFTCAFAHRRGREERERRFALNIEFFSQRENGQNSSSLRPTTALRSFASGTWSGVK